MTRLAWAVLTLAAVLAGCTGSQEPRTPVAVVVAGVDGSGDGRLEVYASPLPPTSSGGGTEDLELLPGFAAFLPGPVVDVAAARGEPARLFALYRDGVGGGDRLRAYDVSALDLTDPATFAQDGPDVDLASRVADAGVLPAGEALCATGLSVSSDGAWAGLVHDPSACGAGASVTNVLLVELAPGGVVGPASPSTDDAPGVPAFASPGGADALVWAQRSGELVALPLDDPAGPPREFATVGGVGDVLDVGLGGRGLVAVGEEALTSVAVAGLDAAVEASAPVDAPSGVRLVAVVDGDALPGTAAAVRGEDELVVVADVDAEAPVTGVADAFGVVDAVLDPYGYAFTVAPASGLAAFDVLTFLAGAEDADPGGTTGVGRVADAALPGDLAPVAIDWAFAPATPGAP